jgi:hypothetical protein
MAAIMSGFEDGGLSLVYTTLNFWYGTDKIGTRTTFLVLGSSLV